MQVLFNIEQNTAASGYEPVKNHVIFIAQHTHKAQHQTLVLY